MARSHLNDNVFTGITSEFTDHIVAAPNETRQSQHAGHHVRRRRIHPALPQDGSVPDIYIAPPLTKQSKAQFLKKMPLVSHIATIYNDTPVPADTEPCSWSHTGRGFKTMTAWTHGFLQSLGEESLAFLIENPGWADKVCNHAKYFLLLFSGSRIVEIYYRHIAASWKLAALARETPACVRSTVPCAVTKKAGVIQYTQIIPLTATCSLGAQQLLTELSYMLFILYPQPVARRILSLLKSKDGNSGYYTHCIPLTSYLGQLFDQGFVAFRPRRLTRRVEPSCTSAGEKEHLVHFSIHWMPQNLCDTNDRIGLLSERDIDSMLRTRWGYDELRDTLCEIDAEMKRPIAEGQEFFVACNSYQSAEDTFILLAFRWSVAMAMCLAGAAGMDDDDTMTEYSDTPMSDEE